MKNSLEIFNKCIEDLKKQIPVKQHGKDYYTVASRHSVLMNNLSGKVSINSEVIHPLCCEHKVAVKAVITIEDYGSFSGLALERYDSSFINKTSALENAETSALGRALAAFGLHGSEFASADELIVAKLNQNGKKEIPKVQISKRIVEVLPKSNGQHESDENLKIDKLFIHTSLDDIQGGIDKKEFKNLGFKVEKLKTLIHKAGFWDSFTKTDEFKTLNKMNLIIRSHINQQRRL